MLMAAMDEKIMRLALTLTLQGFHSAVVLVSHDRHRVPSVTGITEDFKASTATWTANPAGWRNSGQAKKPMQCR